MVLYLKALRVPIARLHISVQARRTLTVFGQYQVPSILTNMMGSALPTKLAEQAILLSHDSMLMPYWLSIVCVTGTVKLLMLPLNVRAIQSASKVPYLEYKLTPLVGELERELRRKAAAQGLSSMDTEKLVKLQIRKAKDEAYENNHLSASNANALALQLLQLPVWLGITFALRNLVYQSRDKLGFMVEQQRLITEVPLNFDQSGFLWIDSFAVPDPYFVVPLSILAVGLLSMQLKSVEFLMFDGPKRLKMSKYVKITYAINFGFVVLASGLSCVLPSGIGFYWLMSSFAGFLLTLSMKYPKVQRLFKILPSPLQVKNPKPLRTFFKSFTRILPKK